MANAENILIDSIGKSMELISFKDFVEQLCNVPFEEIFPEIINGEDNEKSNLG